MAHIVGDRSTTKGQTAKYRCGFVDRPSKYPPRHFGHARKATVKFDKIEVRAAHLVEFQRAADRGFHADRAVIAITLKEAVSLLRRCPHADIDHLVLSDPKSARFGKAGHDEASALVHRCICHHQLIVREGDRAVLLVRSDNLFR